MTWTKFTAPSDLDYDDWMYRRRTGLERSCVDCGSPVMVDRNEVYQIQVCCDDCQQRAKRRQAIRAELAKHESKGVA